MTQLALLIALLAAVAMPALALPIPSLQQIVGRPWQRGPAISLAPHADMIGVKFRVLGEMDSRGVGQWRTIETFLPVGEKMLINEHHSLPSRPESMQITSIPSDGIHLTRMCLVHPSFDQVAADDTIGSGERADMVVVGDTDGEVPLYKHSEGGIMAEEQDVVAISCF